MLHVMYQPWYLRMDERRDLVMADSTFFADFSLSQKWNFFTWWGVCKAVTVFVISRDQTCTAADSFITRPFLLLRSCMPCSSAAVDTDCLMTFGSGRPVLYYKDWREGEICWEEGWLPAGTSYVEELCRETGRGHPKMTMGQRQNPWGQKVSIREDLGGGPQTHGNSLLCIFLMGDLGSYKNL